MSTKTCNLCQFSDTAQDRTNNDGRLSTGTKINDLGWPWAGETQSCGKNRLTKPTRQIWMKIDPYYPR